MTYVDSTLITGEHIVHRGQLHWIGFVPGIILLPFFGLGILFLIAAFIARKTTEMAVTNKRIIIKTGLIRRRTLEMNLGKIENIGVDQGLFARLLNYGTITVVGTGGTRELFNSVGAPLAFRRVVLAQSNP